MIQAQAPVDRFQPVSYTHLDVYKRQGYLHTATDWQDYAEQMLAVLSSEALLENTAPGFAPRPDYRPQTKFEQRGLRLGHGVWDVVFRRRPENVPPRSLEAENDRQDQLA